MFFIALTIALLIFLIVYLSQTNKKKSKMGKYDTNIFSHTYKNEELGFKDFIDDVSSKIPNKDSKDLCKMLDYIFNEFSLKHLEVISEIDEKSVIFSSLVRLKKQQNEFFEDFPSQKPNHYVI